VGTYGQPGEIEAHRSLEEVFRVALSVRAVLELHESSVSSGAMYTPGKILTKNTTRLRFRSGRP
jgi:hypothetical protein